MKWCLEISERAFKAEQKIFYRMLRYELDQMREKFLQEYHRRREEDE